MNRTLSASTAAALLIVGGAALTSSKHLNPVNAAPAPAAIPLSGAWTLDTMHSEITFSIKHFGISEVPGRFDSFTGTIVADAAHPEKSSVNITIDATSLNTNQSMRDADVKSKNYLDVADYPTITYKSTSVKKTGKNTYLAVGNFTLHGVTKVVALPFTVAGPIHDPFGGTRIGIVTGTTINRVAYGVGGDDKLSDGSFALGTDVPVQISVEAVPATPAK